MIPIKTPREQDNLRESGRILASIVNALVDMVEPGIRLMDLETKAEQMMQSAGVKPAFKGYKGYQHVLCTSVNNEVVHCPPTKRVLQAGDIISIDAGIVYNKMYSDCAVTVPVGDIGPEAARLIEVTRTALYQHGLQMIRPGGTIGDIGSAIQQYVEQAGFSIVRSLVGHGIGAQLHEEPSIPNFGSPGKGVQLQPGMAIAVEPMVNQGKVDVEFENDGWRVVTTDGKLSAHFEHTFLITSNGCEIITQL